MLQKTTSESKTDRPWLSYQTGHRISGFKERPRATTQTETRRGNKITTSRTSSEPSSTRMLCLPWHLPRRQESGFGKQNIGRDSSWEFSKVNKTNQRAMHRVNKKPEGRSASRKAQMQGTSESECRKLTIQRKLWEKSGKGHNTRREIKK